MIHVFGIGRGAQVYPVGPPVESASWSGNRDIAELLAYREAVRRHVAEPMLKFACEESGVDGAIVRDKALGLTVDTVLEVEVAGHLPHGFLPDPPESEARHGLWAAFLAQRLAPYSERGRGAIVVVGAECAGSLVAALRTIGLPAAEVPIQGVWAR